LRKRAFLGPIGDDLPSLIPLLFALVMFFSTFTYAFNVFEGRNSSFSDDLAVLKMGTTLKSNGYIETAEAFYRRCANIGPARLNYLAAVTDAATAKEEFIARELGNDASLYSGIDVYFLVPYKVASLPLSCTSLEEWQPPPLAAENLIVRSFPVVVEDNKVVKPMHLVVVAWR
jgi:hypothetical protein